MNRLIVLILMRFPLSSNFSRVLSMVSNLMSQNLNLAHISKSFNNSSMNIRKIQLIYKKPNSHLLKVASEKA